MNVYAISPLLSAMTFLALGLFVLKQTKGSLTNIPFVLMCLSTVGWQLTWTFLFTATDAEQAHLLVRIGYSSIIFMPVFHFHFFSGFVGRQRQEMALLFIFYTTGIIFLILLWTSSLFVDGYRAFFWGFYPKAGVLHPIYLCMVNFLSFRLVQILEREWKRPDLAIQRRIQIKYALVGFIFYFLSASDFLVNYGFEFYPLGFITILLALGIWTYAIVRRQLLDIQVVIRRNLVYSVLIACITATYLVMVLVLEKWFQDFLGYRSLIATAFVGFLIAVFFNPLRSRIQAFIDRALFKATPEELAQQREQLLAEIRKSEQQKAIATLAAGLAHEIKNPLASIKTFTEYLTQRHDDPEFRERFQKIVGGEVERINLIVQQLLEFAKPKPPNLEPVRVEAVVEETLELLSSELVKKHVQVVKDYGEGSNILGDTHQLKQVFLNLLLNSLQAMNGSGCLEIKTGKEGDDTLNVQDSR